MQPPPRKANYAKYLKSLHSEQILKLQLKNQHECDLLEDIRSYTIKRSAIERSYAEALLKISSAYLNKKIPNIPDIKCDGGLEQWNMWNVWRTVLEENEKLARARLAAVEVFSQAVAEDAKHLKGVKLAAARKTLDVLAQIQKELQTTVGDVDKTKKLYFDEEHCAHDVRDKAKDIEEKLKRKKGSFFQSITSLQKNSAKVSSKRDQLEEKSAGARNDYLLCLAAANAHQRRYFLVDLQGAMQTMENHVYDRVAEYLNLIGRTELLTCTATQTSFTRIRDQAQQLSRDYNLQCVYLFYPVLKQHIQYDFDPCDNDPIEKIVAEHSSAAVTLSDEAKRWAAKIGREHNSIKEYNRKLQICIALRESGQKVDPNDPNGPDLDTKIDELRILLRRAETSKMKAEARVECLRKGGVNVDEFMQELDALSVQEIPRSSSSLSVRTDASGINEPPSSDSYYDSDNYEAPDTPKKVDNMPESMEYEEERLRHDSEVDVMLEQERQRIEQLTADWDDPTQPDWGTEGTSQTESVQPVAPEDELSAGSVYKCIALYTYAAQNPDELSMVENEQLEVVGEGDGDGWLKARNYKGEEGYVPQNYLDIDRSLTAVHGGSSYQLNQQISFSSVDYTVEKEVDEPIPEPVVQQEQPQTASFMTPIQVEITTNAVELDNQGTVVDNQGWTADFSNQSAPDSATSIEKEFVNDGYSYCIALYDYDATAPEELTFVENQVIKLLKKTPHDVDDGWWEGELDGNVGLFPSLVVEECRPDGQPLTPEEDESPPASSPPAHTPPDIPTFLLAPQSVIVTQPTPIGEHAEAGVTVNGSITLQNDQFEMNMSKDQHEQYQKIYEAVPIEVDVPVITNENYEEEVEKFKCKKQQVPTFGLGVAEIVITAATPMREEPDMPFPPLIENEEEEEEENADEKVPDIDEKKVGDDESTSEAVTTVLHADDDNEVDDCPTDSAPFPISSSTGSEDEPSSGPSTAENSQSLPEELEPKQLARLKILKESDA